MQEKPKFEQKIDSMEINERDQEAFENLARELILIDKTKVLPPLSYDNREDISLAIQSDLFEYVIKKRNINEEIISGITEDVTVTKTYDPFSFTAQLSEMAQKNNEAKDSPAQYEINGAPLNCIGETFLQSIQKRLLGNKVLFGIAADHPVLFIEDKDGKQYIQDLESEKEIDGIFEEKNGYKIYRTNSNELNNEHFFLFHEPNIAILHEILHNMQILKNGSKHPDFFLPDTEDAGLMISEQYKNILQTGDWEKMRKILCPEIEKSFQENKQEWESEIERIKLERKQGKKIYISAVTDAKNVLGFQDKTMKEFADFIKPKVKMYKEIVNEYFNFLVLETSGFTPRIHKDKKVSSIKEVRDFSILNARIINPNNLNSDNKTEQETRPISREDILNLISDTEVRDFVRILGEAFSSIKDDFHSLYFRSRFSQNILDESL